MIDNSLPALGLSFIGPWLIERDRVDVFPASTIATLAPAGVVDRMQFYWV